MRNREHKVEDYLHDEIEKLGGTTRKTVSPQRKGFPDRFCTVPIFGAFLVELKTVDGPLGSHQAREIERLRRAGTRVYVVSGKNQVDELIGLIRGELCSQKNN